MGLCFKWIGKKLQYKIEIQILKSTNKINMHSLSPNIYVKDINQTINFYKQLGFVTIATVPDAEPFNWAMMKCGTVAFMFQTFESLGTDYPSIKRQDGGSLMFYIHIKGIRKFFEAIKDKVTIEKEIEKNFYGATEFSILDLNGYVLTFAEDE